MAISHARVLELFDYETQTGNLIWKVKASNRIKIGDIAGRVAGNGRRYVNVDGQPVMVHRLVWFYHRGVWPEENLSSENGNYLDTRIENLVPKTAVETVRNGRVRSTNKSGIKGISWDSSDSVWVVHIYRDYKSTYIGRYKLLEHAKRALSDAEAGILPSEGSKAAARSEKMKKVRNRRLWHKMLRENVGVHNWGSMDDFLTDIGEQPEVERCLEVIDPGNPIGPGNFQWASPKFDLKTREGKAAYGKAHRAANPLLYKDKELRKKFGPDFGVDAFQKKLAEQNGVCAICSKPERGTRNGVVRWLNVDHNHGTTAVRGLLCTGCNVAVGMMYENRDTMRAAMAYLDKWDYIEKSAKDSQRESIASMVAEAQKLNLP